MIVTWRVSIIVKAKAYCYGVQKIKYEVNTSNCEDRCQYPFVLHTNGINIKHLIIGFTSISEECQNQFDSELRWFLIFTLFHFKTFLFVVVEYLYH